MSDPQKVRYTCGCTYEGHLASSSCPVHPSYPAMTDTPSPSRPVCAECNDVGVEPDGCPACNLIRLQPVKASVVRVVRAKPRPIHLDDALTLCPGEDQRECGKPSPSRAGERLINRLLSVKPFESPLIESLLKEAAEALRTAQQERDEEKQAASALLEQNQRLLPALAEAEAALTARDRTIAQLREAVIMWLDYVHGRNGFVDGTRVGEVVAMLERTLALTPPAEKKDQS